MKTDHPLRKWRLDQKPKQTLETAAKKFEVTTATVSRWENWRRVPSAHDLLKISRETGIPIDAMIRAGDR